MHIKASKIWQQRLHNYAAYDSVDIPVNEVDVSKFDGDDAEFISLMQVLLKNRSLPHKKVMVGADCKQFMLEYDNGEKAMLDFDELLAKIQRSKNTSEALDILKSLM